MFYMYLGLFHGLILVLNDRYISFPCHGMAVGLLPEQGEGFVVLHRASMKMHQLSVFGGIQMAHPATPGQRHGQQLFPLSYCRLPVQGFHGVMRL
jgi:hypothetical protein